MQHRQILRDESTKREHHDVSVSPRHPAGSGDTARVLVFALWSAPRSRSTAFFRSMLERGDLVALHEPLEGLAYLGPIEVEDRTFASVTSLVAWLLSGTPEIGVFLKETVNRRVLDVVLSEHRFLAEVRHSFLIRRPEEIAVSWYALEQDMRIEDAALVLLDELHTAVREAGGHPVVIDSDDLVARPEATMAAYCAAVGLPFLPDALQWEPGERVEWARSARWHKEVSVSAGFEQRDHPDRRALGARDEVARFVTRQQPFYERLRAHRLDVAHRAGRNEA